MYSKNKVGIACIHNRDFIDTNKFALRAVISMYGSSSRPRTTVHVFGFLFIGYNYVPVKDTVLFMSHEYY